MLTINQSIIEWCATDANFYIDARFGGGGGEITQKSNGEIQPAL